MFYATVNKTVDTICHLQVTEVQVSPSRRFFHPNPFMEVETSDLPARTSNVHYLTFLMKINPHIPETLPGAAQYLSTSLTFLTTWGSDRAVLMWLKLWEKTLSPSSDLEAPDKSVPGAKGVQRKEMWRSFSPCRCSPEMWFFVFVFEKNL